MPVTVVHLHNEAIAKICKKKNKKLHSLIQQISCINCKKDTFPLWTADAKIAVSSSAVEENVSDSFLNIKL